MSGKRQLVCGIEESAVQRERGIGKCFPLRNLRCHLRIERANLCANIWLRTRGKFQRGPLPCRLGSAMITGGVIQNQNPHVSLQTRTRPAQVEHGAPSKLHAATELRFPQLGRLEVRSGSLCRRRLPDRNGGSGCFCRFLFLRPGRRSGWWCWWLRFGNSRRRCRRRCR